MQDRANRGRDPIREKNMVYISAAGHRRIHVNRDDTAETRPTDQLCHDEGDGSSTQSISPPYVDAAARPQISMRALRGRGGARALTFPPRRTFRRLDHHDHTEQPTRRAINLPTGREIYVYQHHERADSVPLCLDHRRPTTLNATLVNTGPGAGTHTVAIDDDNANFGDAAINKFREL